MKIQKLKKHLNKVYWSNKQHLYINSIEVREKDGWDNSLDIFSFDITKKDEWKIDESLFSIYNIKAFNDITSIIPFKSIRTKLPFDKLYSRKIEDINKISYTPFYCNREFFLNKTTDINEDDILMCMEYFCNMVFGVYSIWNIKIYKDKESK